MENHKRLLNNIYCKSTHFFDNVNKNWSDVKKEDVVFYLGKLMRQNKLSMVSIDNRRKCVKTFFNFLEDNDYITKNPYI